jgi:energy-coupling factor transporter ATP-binding protein EcfA2
MWTIEQLEINGGFLPGLKLALPRGLTCIIGPRGSGKSTLAEALRFAMKGITGASKSRLDLLQANLGGTGSVSLVAKTAAGITYTIRRAHRQPPVLLSSDGRTVPDVNLDRGTFLPLDAYSDWRSKISPMKSWAINAERSWTNFVEMICPASNCLWVSTNERSKRTPIASRQRRER